MAKILLIEDDDNLRPTLARFLQSRGHQVSEAANGKHGVEIFAKASADLVITDLLMPEKEGIETMTALRATHPTVKIIAISGLTPRSAFYLQLATKLGADHALPKPFTLEAFSKAVDQVLATPRP
jgi:DNA-binding response OmpR family regulator